MDIAGYLGEIRALHASGQTTEHSFRPALAVINEPQHITDVDLPIP